MKHVKYLRSVDFDKLFHSTRSHKVVINDMPIETEEDRMRLDNLIMTTYENTDVLSPVPACGCGALTGGWRLGRQCPECNTVVERPAETSVEHNVWLRAPEGVKGFISPHIWVTLSTKLSSSRYNLMEWLTNPGSIPPQRLPATTKNRIAQLQAMNWPRGLNNFIDNYDAFIDLLPKLGIRNAAELQKKLRICRDNTFSLYLPMPTKLLLVMENTNRGSFADLPITGAIDAAKTIASLSREGNKRSTDYLERKTVGVIKNISMYYHRTGVTTLRRKRGWFRGQLFSTRVNFSFRSVITSINEPAHYEELHIPWSIGMEVFKYHLINRLKKRGYPVREAFDLVEGHGNQYHPLLAELVDEIIKDTPDGRLHCLFQRNPSLLRNSAQDLPIAKVKKDLSDNTISMPRLALNGPNADFDGSLIAVTKLF